MADLVLLRHGRTDWNAEGRFQGQSNSQLDALGRAQAAAVAPAIAALGPSVLWASDADRARDTAAYVASACGLPVTHDPRLREYTFGDLEGLLRHEFEARDPEAYRAYAAWDWDAVPAIEDYADVAGRMTAVLTELAGTVPDDGVAVAVSHGAAIRTAVAALLGWPQPQSLTLHGMTNCGFTILRRRTADAPWRLVSYNSTVPPDFTEPEAVG